MIKDVIMNDIRGNGVGRRRGASPRHPPAGRASTVAFIAQRAGMVQRPHAGVSHPRAPVGYLDKEILVGQQDHDWQKVIVRVVCGVGIASAE